MIKVNDDGRVEGRELYSAMNIKSRFNDWVRNSVYNADLKENKDYYISKGESSGGRPPEKWLLSQEACMLISFQSKNIDLYMHFKKMLGRDCLIEKRSRKEIMFDIVLSQVFDVEFKKQVSIGSYRVDFLFNDLIVEYDEYYHKSDTQQIKDRKREKDIKTIVKKNRNFLFNDNFNGDITFVRVKEGQESKAINEINKFFIENEYVGVDLKGNYYYSKNDYIEEEKQTFLNQIKNNEVDYNFYKKTKKELIKKILSIH